MCRFLLRNHKDGLKRVVEAEPEDSGVAFDRATVFDAEGQSLDEAE